MDRHSANASRSAAGSPHAENPTLDHDIPCLGCGYNLRGLSHNGNCPECAVAVAASLEQLESLRASPRDLLRIARAANLLVISNSIAMPALSARFWLPGIFAKPDFARLLLDLAIIGGIVAASAGWRQIALAGIPTRSPRYSRLCITGGAVCIMIGYWFDALNSIASLTGGTSPFSRIGGLVYHLFFCIALPLVPAATLIRMNIINDIMIWTRPRREPSFLDSPVAAAIGGLGLILGPLGPLVYLAHVWTARNAACAAAKVAGNRQT